MCILFFLYFIQLHYFLREISFNNSAGEQISFDQNRELIEGFEIVNLLTFPNQSFFRVKVGKLDPHASPDNMLTIHEPSITWHSSFKEVGCKGGDPRSSSILNVLFLACTVNFIRWNSSSLSIDFLMYQMFLYVCIWIYKLGMYTWKKQVLILFNNFRWDKIIIFITCQDRIRKSCWVGCLPISIIIGENGRFLEHLLFFTKWHQKFSKPMTTCLQKTPEVSRKLDKCFSVYNFLKRLPPVTLISMENWEKIASYE